MRVVVVDDVLRRYLSSLGREELVRRLFALAERDEVALMALRAEAAAAAGTFDLAAFRKELTARLRVSGFVDWRGAGRYARRADAVVDVIEGLLDGGRASDVVALAEHVMARLDTAMGRIDDSGGHLHGVVARVADIHHAACVAARPDPRRLAARLVEVALKSEWEWFLDAPERYADVLGEEGLAAYRERLEREWEALPPLGPTEAGLVGRVDGRRFRVTHLREGLARAGGSVDELMAVLARDLSSPFQFCRIADELEQAGREREALAWLERGLAAFPPVGDPRLRSRTIQAYLRDGQVEDALALAQRAFDAEPRAATYRELRTASDGLPDWPTRRAAALDRLRSLDQLPRPTAAFLPPAGRSEAVRAQLDEGDIEGAWRDAQEGDCSMDLWHQLAKQRRNDHPDDAVAVYRHLLDRALTRADVRAYQEAVELLQEVRETLAPHDRGAEFAAEVERIRAEHRRRPKLLSLLDAEGW
jgi:tetratricopeptide (TPR) repeat protein